MNFKKVSLCIGLVILLSAITWTAFALPSGWWKASYSHVASEEQVFGPCGEGLVCAKWIYGDNSGQMGSCCVPVTALGSEDDPHGGDMMACNDDLRHTH